MSEKRKWREERNRLFSLSFFLRRSFFFFREPGNERDCCLLKVPRVKRSL